MPERFLVSAVGAVIEVDVSRRDASFQDRAHAAWADALYEGARSADAVASDRADLSDDAALAMLSTDVTLQALAHRKGEALWMVHAAGLADEHGNVVVLSAPSGTGKTTAARHLAQRYAYISDETVGIDAHGGVIAYRKPLSVIQDDAEHKVQIALSGIDGARPVPATLRVAKIVVLQRSADGPDAPELEELDVVTALEELAPQSSYLGDAQAPLHLIHAILSATGGAVRLRYREVATIDATIAALLRAETAAVQVGAPPARAVVDTTEPAGYRRAAVVDELDLGDGRVAVLQRSDVGTTLRVLDGIGPTVWAAAQGVTLERIVAAVVAEHGTPEGIDATRTVEAAVQELSAAGLLERAPAQT